MQESGEVEHRISRMLILSRTTASFICVTEINKFTYYLSNLLT